MSETLGDQLRLARQERNLSLEQVAEGTHIRLHYLEALETGDLGRLPSKAQARGFVRAYAGFLGLEAEGLLGTVDSGSSETVPDEEPPEPRVAPPPEIGAGGSRLIFKQLGEDLQLHRETLGFSLVEVERNTRVRLRYLKALEDGALEDLPSPVQGRGMLQNYATFLGLDPEPILLRFADGLQARLAEKKVAAAIPTPTSPVPRVSRRALPASIRRLISVDFLLVSVLVISLAGFIIWGALRINSLRVAEAPEATVPSVADALLATPEETLVQTSVLLGPTATDTLPVGTQEEPAGAPTELTTAVEATLQTTLPAISDAPVQVYVTVLQRAWMRATVDGEIEFEGRVLPGSAYAFAGTNQVELLTGNGAALQVFFGREDLGLLGVYGEVVDRVFTPDGLVLPTPTVTPTQSVTIQLTGTVLATETVQPTPEP